MGWYVRRASGETVGPLNEDGVEAELDAGRLMPNGWVCPSGAQDWVLVSAQRPFAEAVQRALVALGDAPTAYTEDAAQQAQLAALYEASIEGRSDLPPSKRPTDPPPQIVQVAMARPPPTVAMPDPVARTQLERTAPMGPEPNAPMASASPHAYPPPYQDGLDAPASIPINPLTEPFGASGWLAVTLTALTALVYILDALVLVLSSTPWGAIVALLASAGFVWATIQLVRRRNSGLRLARVIHGLLLALVSLTLVAQVALNGQFLLVMIVPLALVGLHVASLAMLYVARALFWIGE